MNPFDSVCDDFYVSMHLGTEMDLPTNRETVLHFFERIQKTYPSMRNFSAREKGNFILEQEKDSGSYRWSTIEPCRICSGYVNPESVKDAMEQHKLILDMAPYWLSVSPLDCETLDVMFGFDLAYGGNHSELVAEALGVTPAMESVADLPGATILANDPSITLALDAECRRQCRISIETRTSVQHIRTGEFPEEQLSVYVTGRQLGSLAQETSYVETLAELSSFCEDVIESHVVPNVLTPLARMIALK